MVKNTASQKIGAQMVSATDGSAFTGSVTVYVTIDAGTQAVGSVSSGACTHEGEGYHTYAPAQAETNGTLIAFTFKGTGAVPVTVQVFTTGYDPTAAQLPANVTQFGGSNLTASGGRPEVNTTHAAGTAWGSGAITAASIADGAMTAAKFAANALDAVWSTATRVLTAGTNIALAKGTGVTGFNDLSAAQVNAEADTALSDYDPPTRTELTSDTNSILSKLLKYVQLMLRKDAAIATDNATEVTAINADGGSGAGAFANTTDAQEALRDRGDAAWTTATGFSTLDAAGVRTAVGLASANLDTQLAALPTAGENADAVWEEAIVDHSGTAGSTAEALNAAGSAGDPWTTTLPGSYTGSQAGKVLADVLVDTSTTLQGELDGIQADTEDIQTRLPAALTAGGNIKADALAVSGDATAADTLELFAEALDQSTGQVDNGTFAAGAIDAAAIAPDAIGASELAASAVTEIQSGLSTLDAAGVRTAIGLASANLDTQLDALPTNADLATALAAADDAVLAAIAALNNLSAAQVTSAVPTATENADALLKRDFSAVTGEATRSALNSLRFLRNKWSIAAGTLTVTKEDDTTSAWTGAVTQTAGDPVSEIDPA